MYRCCPGVYEPAEDTEMMLQAPEVMGPILEVGCGTGVVSIYHALRGLSVTATDINPVAIECARRNAELNGVCIDLVLTDLFPDGRFRTVLFNPPYLPAEEWEPPEWNGGSDGLVVVRRFLERLPEHLMKGGQAYIILSDLSPREELFSRFDRYEFTEVSRRVFEFEAIFLYVVRVDGEH